MSSTYFLPAPPESIKSPFRKLRKIPLAFLLPSTFTGCVCLFMTVQFDGPSSSGAPYAQPPGLPPHLSPSDRRREAKPACIVNPSSRTVCLPAGTPCRSASGNVPITVPRRGANSAPFAPASPHTAALRPSESDPGPGSRFAAPGRTTARRIEFDGPLQRLCTEEQMLVRRPRWRCAPHACRRRR